MKSRTTAAQLTFNFGATDVASPLPDLPTPAEPFGMTHPAMPPINTFVSIDSTCAQADLDAIEAWIGARCDETDVDGLARLSNTARGYRKEARRFLFWLQVERAQTLATATLEDCTAYRTFMSNPSPKERWCARRGARKSSGEWRPFEGPVSARGRRQAMSVLSGLYRFLQNQGYLLRNPWSGVAPPRNSAPRIDPGRSLNPTQWEAVEAVLRDGDQGLGGMQLRWVVRFLFATGLRRSEMVGANCCDLVWTDFETEDEPALGRTHIASSGSWFVQTMGKGCKTRLVPVASPLIEELGQILAGEGRSTDPRASPDRPLLLAGIGTRGAKVEQRRLSGQGLYWQLKRLFKNVSTRQAQQGRHQDAEALERASTHWLRHSHGSHAVAAGVPIDILQQNLGHRSIGTTTIYARSDLMRRVQESRRLILRPA